VRFALTQAGSTLFTAQALGLGIIILGLFRGDEAVGLFGIALSLQGLGAAALIAIFNIMAPVVSSLYESGQKARLESLYQATTRWSATVSFPVFAALMLEGDFFLRMLAGDRALEAVPVVAVLAIGNVFFTGTGLSGTVIAMTGRPGVILADSVFSVVLYAVLGVWGASRLGLIGIAIVDATVTIVINLVKIVQVKKLVGIQPFGRTFFKPVAATLAGSAVLLLSRLVPVDGLVADGARLAVAGAVMVLLLRRMGLDPEERHILDIMKGKLRRKRAA
jgi:O-antigen/teichoic acid export membrane protein